MASGYPVRDPMFSVKFCREMTRCGLAQQIGADGCWLLMCVVNYEDEQRYSRPLNFYNSQLMLVTGIESENRLDRVRKRAVEAGWLHYEPGAKRRPGVYWVLLPESEDSPRIDHECTSKMEEQTGSKDEILPAFSTDSSRLDLQNGGESGEKAGQCGGPPILYPNPIPLPISKSGRARQQRTFLAPSLEEVAAYCQQRGNSVNPQRFIDHYTANGWMVGKSKMKDWQAAVRTWESRDAEFSGPQAANNHRGPPSSGLTFSGLQAFLENHKDDPE